MQTKITNRVVAAAQPREAPYDVPDTEVPGFSLRVMPSGVKTFCVRYRLPDGRRNRLKIGSASVLKPISEEAIRYLNRLSDLLFVLSRWVNHQEGIQPPEWSAGVEEP